MSSQKTSNTFAVEEFSKLTKLAKDDDRAEKRERQHEKELASQKQYATTLLYFLKLFIYFWLQC